LIEKLRDPKDVTLLPYGVSLATGGVLKPTAVPRGIEQEEQLIEKLFSSCVVFSNQFLLRPVGIVLAPFFNHCPCESFFIFEVAKRIRMRTRLLFLLVLLMVCAQTPANAQQPAKAPHIVYLTSPRSQSFSLPSESRWRYASEPFFQGLRELGYIEGQNVIVTSRIGNLSQLSDFAAALVQRKVDVIVTENRDSTRAAMKITKTIPIVMTLLGDPVFHGFVANLDRPGGNVTGVSGLTLELGGKWLELLRETIPSLRRVAVFWYRRAEDAFPVGKSLDHAARSLGVDLNWLEVRNPEDLARRFRAAIWSKADAFIVLPGSAVDRNMAEIAELGLKNRLPGIFWHTAIDLNQIGGLMAYGANRHEQSRRAAYVVNKILKGAKPAELPVELPKSFDLVINRKVANELGITIPTGMLAWADHVFR
jgi:putative ABC transport system substrate-binding protein